MKTVVRTMSEVNVGDELYLIGTGQFILGEKEEEIPHINVEPKELPRYFKEKFVGVVSTPNLEDSGKLADSELLKVYPELLVRFERIEAEVVGEVENECFFNTYEVNITTKPTKRDVAGRKKKLEEQSQLLRGILKTHGLTQRKFAREIGVTTSTVASWLNNRSLMDDFNEGRVRDWIRKLEDK